MRVDARAASQNAPNSGDLPARIRRLWQTQLPEICVVLVGALTRFWRLDYHSVWFDEAVSLGWAGADPGFMWRTTVQLVEDKHPPAYYLGLHLWQRLATPFGLAQNDAMLRTFGSVLGVLTVLGILLLVRRLSGRSTGLLAALFVALSPVLVWYSQELRMFQPATTACVWAAYFLLRAWTALQPLRRVGWWAAFVAALTTALYTYLFSAFILPAAGCTVLALHLWRRKWRRFSEGVAALALTTLLFLPLARNAWGVNADESTPGQAFADFLPHMRRLLKVFTIWREQWPDPLVAGCLLLLAALLFAGLLLPTKLSAGRDRSEHVTLPDRAWLATWLGIPLLIANLLLSRSGSIFSQDRYLLFLAPFALWSIARGVTAIGQRWRPAGWILAGGVSLMLAAALPILWTPAQYRENWRAAASYASEYQSRSLSLPGAVVAHINYMSQPISWYLRQEVGFDELPLYAPYGSELTPEETDDVIAPPLLGIVESGAATLWLAQSHLEGVDEARLVEGWLADHFPLVTEVFPTGIKLSGYALQSQYGELPQLGAHAAYLDAELAPGLSLAACEIMTPELSATDEVLHAPSGWVHVRLWWQASGAIDDDYIASAQVIGEEGVWGDRLYRENEALRRGPTSGWQVGDIVRDEVDINLNPLTPAREFPVVIGLLDRNGAPAAQTAECGRVKIR